MIQVDAITQTEPLRIKIANTIARIPPCDDLEQEHIRDTLCWIKQGAPIFRIKKPDIPPKHLVSYFILLDRVVTRCFSLIINYQAYGCRLVGMLRWVNILNKPLLESVLKNWE